MLLFLDAPVTLLDLVFAVGTVIAVFAVYIIYSNRPKWPAMNEELIKKATTSYTWLRKSGGWLLLLAFVILYPFMQPLAHAVANTWYGVSGMAHAGNATGAEIAADQVAGGGVQLGTFLTKLWITVIFFLIAKVLPWQIQKLTHPAPTAWAQTDYKTDFASLNAPEKFAAYGRLQYVDAAKFIGAGLIAALLV